MPTATEFNDKEPPLISKRDSRMGLGSSHFEQFSEEISSEASSLDSAQIVSEYEDNNVDSKVIGSASRELRSRGSIQEPVTPTKKLTRVTDSRSTAQGTRSAARELEEPRSRQSTILNSPQTPGDQFRGLGEVSSSLSESSVDKKTPSKKPTTKSPFFTPPASAKKKRAPGGLLSCIPFPPLSADRFGLLQEKLANDPLRLLIGVTFLIRTHGRDSIPVYFELMEKYPTPEALAAANKEDIITITRHLGLQSTRADTYIKYATMFLNDPPVKGRRYRVENYPSKGDHIGIKKGEVLSDDDRRLAAWEIGHLTKGRYALDSWRIFCRDKLRGLADGFNGEGAPAEFQPEWMRVLPQDKELRAFLRWMWLKEEGFEWDPFTGEKEVASKELMDAAREGRIVWDDFGGMRIVDIADDGAVGDGQELDIAVGES